MSDPIEMLEALPPESPPRAAVLASLRLFRYRAMATILVAMVFVLGLALVARSADQRGFDADLEDIVGRDRVEFRPAAGTALLGAVQVLVTEVAMSPDGNAARLIFVDTGTPEREIQLEVLAVRQAGGEATPAVSIPLLGRDVGRASTATWVPLDPVLDPFGATIDVLVLPIPDSILDEGGVLTSDDGLTGVVTIERKTSP